MCFVSCLQMFVLGYLFKKELRRIQEESEQQISKAAGSNAQIFELKDLEDFDEMGDLGSRELARSPVSREARSVTTTDLQNRSKICVNSDGPRSAMSLPPDSNKDSDSGKIGEIDRLKIFA